MLSMAEQRALKASRMNPNQTLNVDAGKLIRENLTVTVHARGAGWQLFRMRCAIPFLRLASLIAGTGLEIDLARQRGW